MPIYEYVCNACSHEFEEWQKITDSPVRKCPSCGKRKVERLVSLSAFHLKGSGWYVTDYGGKKPGRPGEKNSGGDNSDSSESKSDSSESKSDSSKSDKSDSKGDSKSAKGSKKKAGKKA
jgi:putative FmdB family regulatory protein